MPAGHRAGRVYGRHLFFRVIVRSPEVLRAEEPENRACGDSSHEAALLIEPFGVALFRNAIADERQARCAQCDQLVGIHGNIPGIFAAEVGFGRAIFQEIARHPVVFAGSGQILHRFAKIAPMQFGSAFAGRAYQNDGETLIESHCHQGCFAVT